MECPRPDISVLVATRNRAHLLEQLLSSLESQELEGLSFELIVIDNGSVDDTQTVLKRGASRFNLVAFYEETPGKSRALNRGLEVTAGDLVVFTDDDITACPHWLQSLHKAFAGYESAAVFCGPIIPSFPPGTPEWIANHPSASMMYGRFKPNLDEGPLPGRMLPYGANFAVRSSAVRGMRFRLDLGPAAENDGPLLGEDTEFVLRARGESQEIIFVPSAHVYHHVPPDNIEFTWLVERAFQYGRCVVMIERQSVLPDVLDQSFELEFEMAGVINYYVGQLYQLHQLGVRSFDHGLRDVLDHLNVDSNLHLLSKSARQFYLSLAEAQDEQFVPSTTAPKDSAKL